MVTPPMDFRVSGETDAIPSTPPVDGQHALVTANCDAGEPCVDRHADNQQTLQTRDVAVEALQYGTPCGMAPGGGR